MKTLLMLNPPICASTTNAAWPGRGTAIGWSALLNSILYLDQSMYSGMFAMVTSASFTSRVNFFNSLLEIPVIWIMFICPCGGGKSFGWSTLLSLLDLELWRGWRIWCILYHRVRLYVGARVQRLVELLEVDELSTILEQVSQLLDAILRVDVGVQVTGSVQLLRNWQIGHSRGTRLPIAAATSGSTAIVVSPIVPTVIASVIASIITPVCVTSRDHVGIIGCIVATVPPLLAAFIAVISSVTQVIRVSPIIFIVVVARARLLHVVFAISPTVGDLHQLGDSLQLQVTELFYVGLPPDAVTEGVDCPVDGDIFGCVQELGKAPDIRAHRFLLLLAALAQFFDSHGPLVCRLEVFDESVDSLIPRLDGPAWQAP